MFRAPLYFAAAYIAGLVGLLAEASSELLAIYTIVSGGVLAGFTAVWVKLWQMHTDWKADKNATIVELKARVQELEERQFEDSHEE